MGDYSLISFPNLLAQTGDELVLHRFPSGSLGLASVADLQSESAPLQFNRDNFWKILKEFFTPAWDCAIPAVCIPPGARLQLHQLGSRFRQDHGLAAEE